MSERGSLIAFEGIEGAGKSTQIERAAALLRSRGHTVVETREPGGTELGREIRRLVMSPREVPPTPLAELLLYLADRDQHLSEVVRPALDRGEIVITDRFSDSTIAYQGCARRLDLPMVVRLDDIVRRGLSPHLTVLLDCPVSVGLGRARGNDRFHQEDGDFHGRVRQGLLAQAERAPARYAVIDAAQPAATVEKEVLAAVLRCVEGR